MIIWQHIDNRQITSVMQSKNCSKITRSRKSRSNAGNVVVIRGLRFKVMHTWQIFSLQNRTGRKSYVWIITKTWRCLISYNRIRHSEERRLVRGLWRGFKFAECNAPKLSKLSKVGFHLSLPLHSYNVLNIASFA
jgi:hypothetical protein